MVTDYLTESGLSFLDKTLRDIVESSKFEKSFDLIFSHFAEHRIDTNYIKKLGKRKLSSLIQTLFEVDIQVNTNAYKIEHLIALIETLVLIDVVDFDKLKLVCPKFCDKCIFLLHNTRYTDNIDLMYLVHYDGKVSLVGKSDFSVTFPRLVSGRRQNF